MCRDEFDNNEENQDAVSRCLKLAAIGSSIGRLETLYIYACEQHSNDGVLKSVLKETIEELTTISGMKDKRLKSTDLNYTPVSSIDVKAKTAEVRNIRLNKVQVQTPKAPEPVEKVYEKQVDFNQPRLGFDFKESSNIKHIDYFPYTKNMNITFVKTVLDENKQEVMGPDNKPIHRVYSYFDVSREEILEAINAEEPSKAFNSMKNAHRYEETTESVGAA